MGGANADRFCLETRASIHIGCTSHPSILQDRVLKCDHAAVSMHMALDPARHTAAACLLLSRPAVLLPFVAFGRAQRFDESSTTNGLGQQPDGQKALGL